MPVGVQCPISSSLGEFPSYWDWLWCPGLSPVLVSIALPFAFHTWCFPFAFICHWISIVFLLYGRRIATHSVDPSLTRFLGEFPGLDWLWYPMLWSQRRNSGAHGAENSIQISALAVVEPRSLASIAAADVAIRLPRTPPFSRLLRHAGGYSRTILTPNLQGLELYMHNTVHAYNTHIHTYMYTHVQVYMDPNQ